MVDWDNIIPLYYPTFPTEDGFQNKEEVIAFFEEILTGTGDWTANAVATRARRLDKEGAANLVNGHAEIKEPLKELYSEAKNLGVFGLGVEKEYGGLGLPITVPLVAFTQMNRACISSATQISFFTSIADMLERFADQKTKERLVPLIANGDISGSMCLTEPGAGSDVGSLRASATPQGDGTYLINGTKIFITNGGGGLGLVLARIKGAPEGLDGISLFLVEEYVDGKPNYHLGKIEEKMGLHGSMTCEVVYENSKGTLIGKENEGFSIMLYLMNEARLAVGMQALGGIEASLHYMRQYAETRTQFGKPLTELPLYKRNLTDYETERDAFRAFIVDTVSHFEFYQYFDKKERHAHELNEKEKKLYSKAKKVMRRRTPLVKAYGAETYTLFSQRAIQGLGGYGYMQEYDAERYHRDSFGPLLYEGTTQIQALMAMKDLMKIVMKNPKKYFGALFYTQTLGGMITGKNDFDKKVFEMKYEFKMNLAKLLIKCLRPDKGFSDIDKLFNAKAWQSPEGIDNVMMHAETLYQALSYLEVLGVLAKHAAKDSSREELFNRYQRLVAPRLAGIYTDWKIFKNP